eukprot:CAMPEP_0198224422 /NCGR_PEP_ID=MMETSP1445-20131203/96889_1 /TAXON_ID=36898 /ORGANISM="Pyramimonas sp., Strain CCMP2087" /LENGTH=43 /DNA_ID= /DNA_START= /DNA_END= /DNA_ORIENTATION=
MERSTSPKVCALFSLRRNTPTNTSSPVAPNGCIASCANAVSAA